PLATPMPAPPTRPPGPLTALAVAPDGQYAAYVSPGKGTDLVYIRPVDSAAPGKPLRLAGVTSLTWDRDEDVWFIQGGQIYIVPAGGSQALLVDYQGPTPVSLRIAPDGVRVALLVQTGSTTYQVELGAIIRGGTSPAQRGSPGQRVSISRIQQQLAPSLPNPSALTWYDADDLLVLAGTDRPDTLYEVPVDGRDPSAQ